jgi:hypothetical protein
MRVCMYTLHNFYYIYGTFVLILPICVSVLAQAALAALAVYATQESCRLQERRGDRLRKR